MPDTANVRNYMELLVALRSAHPGDTILLSGGDYGKVTLNNFNFAEPGVNIGPQSWKAIVSFAELNLQGSSGLNFGKIRVETQTIYLTGCERVNTKEIVAGVVRMPVGGGGGSTLPPPSGGNYGSGGSGVAPSPPVPCDGSTNVDIKSLQAQVASLKSCNAALQVRCETLDNQCRVANNKLAEAKELVRQAQSVMLTLNGAHCMIKDL